MTEKNVPVARSVNALDLPCNAKKFGLLNVTSPVRDVTAVKAAGSTTDAPDRLRISSTVTVADRLKACKEPEVAELSSVPLARSRIELTTVVAALPKTDNVLATEDPVPLPPVPAGPCIP